MTCLKCGKKIMLHRYKSNPDNYYRCKNKSCGGVIRAKILEGKIRDIVINKLPEFYPYRKFDPADPKKQEKIREIMVKKNEIIKSLVDGNCKASDRQLIYQTEKEMDYVKQNINRGTDTFWWGDAPIVKKLRVEHIENQEKILNSDNSVEINKLYKDLIKIDINIKEKYGVIYFLLHYPDSTEYIFSNPEENLYIYKFSL